MAVDMLFSDSLLAKVGLFVIVQALVYLIISGSSTVFSEEKTMKRLGSFRPARSVSIRRMMALLSDMAPEADPSSSSSATPRVQAHEAEDRRN